MIWFFVPFFGLLSLDKEDFKTDKALCIVLTILLALIGTLVFVVINLIATPLLPKENYVIENFEISSIGNEFSDNFTIGVNNIDNNYYLFYKVENSDELKIKKINLNNVKFIRTNEENASIEVIEKRCPYKWLNIFFVEFYHTTSIIVTIPEDSIVIQYPISLE